VNLQEIEIVEQSPNHIRTFYEDGRGFVALVREGIGYGFFYLEIDNFNNYKGGE
jgi:hypothetical protein